MTGMLGDWVFAWQVSDSAAANARRRIGVLCSFFIEFLSGGLEAVLQFPLSGSIEFAEKVDSTNQR